MEYKLCLENWSQFDFLINNFYEIVEYKRGRGIYGDRIILRRARNAENILSTPDKHYDFFYLDAHNVKELPRTIAEKIALNIKFVCDPQLMTQIIRADDKNVISWSLDLRKKFNEAKTIDYNVLNNLLVQQYQLLSQDFLARLHEHRARQYFLASSPSMNLVSKEFAETQINLF
ncbi:MAG: hypothetical protein J6C90_02175 [Clostridia bacterium]|nr:hypothetical protein [Clostridia bacterium]